jgi:hypothetical protein
MEVVFEVALPHHELDIVYQPKVRCPDHLRDALV